MSTETITLEEFMVGDYPSYEYVRGQLVSMPSTTMAHGEISVNLVTLLNVHVSQQQLGRVYSAETTFAVGKSGRKPDVAFVSQERLPEDRRQASPIPPDLAIEVVSPTDSAYDIEEKVFEYLEAGTRLVWVINPVLKTVTVYRSQDDIKILTRNQTLTGEDVVEGFSCLVEEIFA